MVMVGWVHFYTRIKQKFSKSNLHEVRIFYFFSSVSILWMLPCVTMETSKTKKVLLLAVYIPDNC